MSLRRRGSARKSLPYGAANDEPAPSDPETTTEWLHAHERIVALGKERAGHERQVCRWLLCAERLRVFARCGYASLREYAERLLGLSGRQTEERRRVGRALIHLPELDRALASGALSWSAVRELTRIATSDTESAWLDWAEGRRAHEVETGVAARLVGDGPDAPPDSARIKHRLSFAVRAETMALFRDLQAKVRADLGGDADDDMLLFEIARRALGGSDDEGRASYQVAVSRCEECGRTSIEAAGTSEVVDDAVAEMIACDGQHLGGVGAAGEPPRGGKRTARNATSDAHDSARRSPTGDAPRPQALRGASRRWCALRQHAERAGRRCRCPGAQRTRAHGLQADSSALAHRSGARCWCARCRGVAA